MDIVGWRKQIDELDRKLVALLNQRATAAHEIGKLLNFGLLVVMSEENRAALAFEIQNLLSDGTGN